MTLTIRYVARSDVGLVREGNEDSGYAGPRLLAVADGMGGHAAGEVASSATIDEIVKVESSRNESRPLDALGRAVRAANDRIRQLVADDPGRSGMGTTLTALLWTGTEFQVAHIGDSRAYLLRDNELQQITHDHTFVQSLVDDGRISQDEAGVHPARSLILKALDGGNEPELDLHVFEARAGDRVMVCSDGLSGVVSDETLRDTLSGHPELIEAADALLELALRGGGPDNITVVVADIIETERPPSDDDTVEVYLVGAAAGEEAPPRKPSRRRRMATRNPRQTDRVEDIDPEALRYAPQPPRRFRWLRRIALVLVIGAVAWAGASLANDWVRGQYYVGAQAGEVAIFRGVSQEVGPLRLSDLYDIADGLPVGALPPLVQSEVSATIPADNLSDAQRIVAELRTEACNSHPPVMPESPNPSPSPTAGATPVPLAAPTPGYPGLECPETQ